MQAFLQAIRTVLTGCLTLAPTQHRGKREVWQETRYEMGPDRGDVASCRYAAQEADLVKAKSGEPQKME